MVLQQTSLLFSRPYFRPNFVGSQLPSPPINTPLDMSFLLFCSFLGRSVFHPFLLCVFFFFLESFFFYFLASSLVPRGVSRALKISLVHHKHLLMTNSFVILFLFFLTRYFTPHLSLFISFVTCKNLFQPSGNGRHHNPTDGRGEGGREGTCALMLTRAVLSYGDVR